MEIDFRLNLNDYMKEWKRLIRRRPYRIRVLIPSILIPCIFSLIVYRMDMWIKIPFSLLFMVLIAALITYRSYDTYKTAVMLTPGITGNIRCEINQDGFRWVSQFKDYFSAWKLIHKVEMDMDNIYFYLREVRYFVPIKGFESMDAARGFYGAAIGYLKEYRARESAR